jgi:heptosyltransferase-3
MDIDWSKVNKILIIKLRSIGDTVLATPSLTALRRFRPSAQIDIALEPWVAPVLESFPDVDNVLTVGDSFRERLAFIRRIRDGRYDVAFNLHGGTTATLLSFLSGARHRVGLASYQYSFLYNHRIASPLRFWGRSAVHSAEQQLALLGGVGVPVQDPPASSLGLQQAAMASIGSRLRAAGVHGPFAVMHPTTAFFTKQWPVENFARVAEFLAGEGITTVALSSPAESTVLDQLSAACKVPVVTFDDLKLPEVTALAARAALFVGNDSGLAHIAAAVGTPLVVIFGSSNRHHWRPWTEAPNEMVFKEYHCQPCPGYECKQFGDARCIRELPVAAVVGAIKRVLKKEKAGTRPASVRLSG